MTIKKQCYNHDKKWYLPLLALAVYIKKHVYVFTILFPKTH